MEISQVNAGGVQAAQVRSATRSTLPMKSVPAQANEPAAEQDDLKLTQAEKQYFEDVFPGAAQEIRQHAVYHKNGIRQPASLGTVVDRRG